MRPGQRAVHRGRARLGDRSADADGHGLPHRGAATFIELFGSVGELPAEQVMREVDQVQKRAAVPWAVYRARESLERGTAVGGVHDMLFSLPGANLNTRFAV
jgi:hypothetical protein